MVKAIWSKGVTQGERFRKHVANFDGYVFVETLDGTPGEDHLSRLLTSWGIDLVYPGIPLVRDPQQISKIIDDEAYIPCYDTVWLIERRSDLFYSPPFITWYAANSNQGLPRAESGGNVEWSIVEQWMDDVGARVGLSKSVYLLEILRDGHE